MSEYDRYGDYIHDNEVLTTAVDRRVEAIIAQANMKTTVAYDLGTGTHEISGGVSLEDVHAAYPGLTLEEAESIVTAKNESIIAVAKMDVHAIGASSKMTQISEEFEKLRALGKTDDEIHAELNSRQYKEPRFAQCSHTQYHDEAKGAVIDLKVTKLYDENNEKYAWQSKVAISDEFIERTVRISKVGDSYTDVSANSAPVEDSLLRRVVAGIRDEEAYGKVFDLMVGRINTDEVDSVLSEIRRLYQGTSQEQEVVPLLEEIGIRARSVSEARNLAFEFGTNKPSFQELKELDEYLGQF